MSSLLFYPVYYLTGYRRKTVRQNLVNSFPEKSLEEIIFIEKEFYKHLTDMIFENIKLNSISKEEVKKRVTVSGIDLIKEEYKKGNKVLLCSSHYGNWEIQALSLNLQLPGKTIVIYKPLSSSTFDAWYKYWRSRFGAVLVPMRDTLRALIRHDKDDYAVCFASDQSPAKGDVTPFIHFLNQPTAVLLGIEKIARKTGNPIFYTNITKTGRGMYHLDFRPLCLNPKETEDLEITKMHFAKLEELIRREPAYWLWSHNRWKNKPLEQNEQS